MSSLLTIKQLCKRFAGADGEALCQVSLSVNAGDVLTIVGSSGSGKSTLLRMLAGFDEPTAGEIYVGDKLLCSATHSMPPEKRRFGVVVAGNSLFPHLTVMRNVTYGISTGDAVSKARALLERLELGDLADRYPHELSTGQQQRVALARSLAIEPQLLLLDEPFSNLDNVLRRNLRDAVIDLVAASGMTIVWTTHEVEDALAVADRILVLREGAQHAFGTPEELLENPPSAYVAQLLGHWNVFPARQTEKGRVTVFCECCDKPDGHVLCVRPDRIRQVADGVACAVVRVQQFGSHLDLLLHPRDPQWQDQRFHVHLPSNAAVERNSIIHLGISDEDCRWLPA
jgi:iron(III) transport system ATP-binding protein